MNPTSLEYLYQIAPPVQDRAPSTSRADSDSSGFDDHLSQAASTVFDIVRSPNPPANRPLYSPSSRSSQETDNSALSDSTTRRPNPRPTHKDTSSNDSHSAENSNSATDQARATSRHDDKRDRHRDKDKSDDEQAASVAGASRAASKDSTRDTDKTSKNADRSDADDSKDKIAADELSEVPTAETGATIETNAKLKDGESDASVGTNAKAEVEETARGISENVTDTTGEESAKTAEAAKSAKVAARSNRANEASVKGDVPQTANAETSTTANSATVSTKTDGAVDVTQTDAQAAQVASGATTLPKTKPEVDSRHPDKDSTHAAIQAGTAVAADAINSIPTVAAVAAANALVAVADKSQDSDDSATQTVTAKPDAAIGTLGRALGTDLGASSKTSNAGESSPVDVARFVSRVAKAVQTANDRDGVVQLRLSPPELGSLKIQLTVKDGVMSASLEADNSNARRMLLDHLPALRDRLAGQNIRVDRFDVDVKQENNGGQANPRGSNQNPYQQRSQDTESHRTTTKAPQVSEVTPVEAAVTTPRVSATGINLVI